MSFSGFLTWKPALFFYRRCKNINKKTEINEAIRDRELRVIGEDGEQYGIMSAKEALELAAEKKLDLVKIAPQAVPPVCRIMDFGKHKYESAKREKEARKKQKMVELKEVRLGLNIEEHDMETKAKMAAKFLQKGDKVKVSLRFRGREMGHAKLGEAVIKHFAEMIQDSGDIEKMPSLEGRTLVAIFAPKK